MPLPKVKREINEIRGPIAMDLAKFAKWAVECSFEGCDLDGGDTQDMAVKCGILTEVKYDPKVHGEYSEYVEPGDPWYVFSDEFKAAQTEG
jgi:hypothetical protein